MTKHAVFTFGRMNPPTTGHHKLVDAVIHHAAKNNAHHYVFVSHTHDPKKNPLNYEKKVGFIKKLFPKVNVVHTSKAKNIIDVMKHLESRGHKEVTMVAGSDRVDEFHRLLNRVNGKDYKFNKINVVSAGDRDPDTEGVAGMSASKMRNYAKNNDFPKFSQGVPRKKYARSLFNAVRKGMNLKEDIMPNFKAVFLVGGPGSGKDFLIRSVLEDYQLKEVSLEKLFKAILEQNNLEDLNDFPSIIVNGNADNKDKIIVAKAILESMGYDTSMIFVYTSDDESKKRNDIRISNGAKTFNESVRAAKYTDSVKNMHEYAEMFECFVLYDNSNNISTVSEEKKKEITNWLIELSETVNGFLSREPMNEEAIKWMNERVLEVGTKATADFIRALTPGQEKSNIVRTYAQADKATCKSCKDECSCNDTGTAVADYAAPGRTFAEQATRKQSIPPGKYENSKSVAVGSMGIASLPVGSPVYNEDKPTKVVKKAAPALTQTWNAANFGNPDSSMGITAYRISEAYLKKMKKKIKEN